MPLPPKPPKHGPEPPPPPHEAEGHVPPHVKDEIKKRNLPNVLLKAVLIGSTLTLIVGIVLFFFGIDINVILPVVAPVWAGSTTLIFTYFYYKQ